MTDFTKLKQGDKIKVCWISSKNKKICSIETVEEVTQNKIVLRMLVDCYRLIPFTIEGKSFGVHEYWLELM